MNLFLANHRWTPSLRAIFAGGLPYRDRNWFTRWVMKQMVGKAKGDTDTSRDYEYTNWKTVEDLACDIAHFSRDACRTNDFNRNQQS